MNPLALLRLWWLWLALASFGGGWTVRGWYESHQQERAEQDAARVADETDKDEASKQGHSKELADATNRSIHGFDRDPGARYRCVWEAIRQGRTPRCVQGEVYAGEGKPPETRD